MVYIESNIAKMTRPCRAVSCVRGSILCNKALNTRPARGKTVSIGCRRLLHHETRYGHGDVGTSNLFETVWSMRRALKCIWVPSLNLTRGPKYI